MRIVAGEYKGRRLESPKGEGTRPTTDRVREALMSSIVSAFSGHLDDVRVLDAFAGTGALGLEALSRGAKHSTFFEKDRTAVALLKRNISSLGVPESRFTVCASDVFTAFDKGRFGGKPFDLVFLDPPYAYESAKVCDFIARMESVGMIASGAVVLYEHAEKTFVYDTCILREKFDLLAMKHYGKTNIAFMRYVG